VWSLRTSTCVLIYTGPPSPVTSVSLFMNANSHPLLFNITKSSPQKVLMFSKYLLEIDDDIIKVWSLRTSTCVLIYTGHTSTVTSVRLLMKDNSNPRVLSISETETIVWELLTGLFIRYFPKIPQVLVVLHYSNIIVTAEGNSIEIWDLNEESDNAVKSVKAHKDIITNIKSSTNEKKIITSSQDKTIKFWNIKGSDITLLTTLTHDSMIKDMDFLSSEKLMYSLTDNNIFWLWNTNEGSFLSKMKLESPININIFRSNFQVINDEGILKIIQSNQEKMVTDIFTELNFDKETIIIGKNEKEGGTQIIILSKLWIN